MYACSKTAPTPLPPTTPSATCPLHSFGKQLAHCIFRLLTFKATHMLSKEARGQSGVSNVSTHLSVLCREFREDQFLDLVGPCFQLLANFMLSAAEFDSQLQVRRGSFTP